MDTLVNGCLGDAHDTGEIPSGWRQTKVDGPYLVTFFVFVVCSSRSLYRDFEHHVQLRDVYMRLTVFTSKARIKNFL